MQVAHWILIAALLCGTRGEQQQQQQQQQQEQQEPQKPLTPPLDAGWSEWGQWSDCSVTCDSGSRERSRSCNNPPPAVGGKDCFNRTNYGEHSAKIEVEMHRESCWEGECPIDGGWSDWSPWGLCSVTCDGGTRKRSRKCDNPVPEYGGADCDGEDEQTEPCGETDCPIHGNWSEWSEWTTCSVTCGGGYRERFRECNNPPPQFGGNECSGSSHENCSCKSQACPKEPIDGAWSDWSPWGACSVTCGEGTRTRTRKCNNPAPQYGGKQCGGLGIEVGFCFEKNCSGPLIPIDGGWSEWGEWGPCNVTCGGGRRERSRECNNPAPENNGKDCVGNSVQTGSCNDQDCPNPAIDGGWSDWSEWGPCNAPCGVGHSERTRECNNPPPQNGGKDCEGNDKEEDKCRGDDCEYVGGWSDWTQWGTCSTTCGDGIHERRRFCDSPPPPKGGEQCPGESQESETCNQGPCLSNLLKKLKKYLF